uniref:Heat shock protein 70 n=1 Tax=Panagrolaimus davidi TaxID=227884 RepID=A0A914PJW6_9BILA
MVDVKKLLNKKEFALINLVKLSGNIDFKYQITQARFNELCKELVEKTLGPVKNVLEIAKLEKKDVTNVLLVGGSTRIPYIRKRLFEFFDQKNLNFDINPDEAVAHGATLLAAHLSKQFDTSIQNIRLLDVIPRSLGTDLYKSLNDKSGYFNIVAERGTKIPFEKKDNCSTIHKSQTVIDFVIYEGEDSVLANNNKLGTFKLKNIPKAPRGVPDIEITFKVNENAILTVSAVDKTSGSSESIEIHPNKGRLTDEEITEMIHDIQIPDIIEID